MISRLFGRSQPTESAAPFAAALLKELPRLRRYAIVLVGDLTMADDLIQDTVERALKRQGSLDDQARLYPWLRSILRNLHIDEIRRKRVLGSPVDIDDLADTLAVSVGPMDVAVAVDFTRAMASLSLEHREIMLLVALEGLSYREIAEELSIPMGTVMSRLARAREQLRLKLEEPAQTATLPVKRARK